VGEFWWGERKGGVEIEVQRERCQPFLRKSFASADGVRNGASDLSAQDMRDAHLVVVDDRREMVRREEIRLEQDGIGGE
jgi:hypothetical protein